MMMNKAKDLESIVVQPNDKIQWMPKPDNTPISCPPGLEYLNQIDQILVHQQIELFEVMTNIEGPNRYAIKNTLGQQIYFASEESDFCHRCMCHEQRGFVMHICDNQGTEVMRINRPFKCCSGCSCCACIDHCAHELQVEAPPGKVIGSIRQAFSMWRPKAEILDENGQVVFKMEGPCCPCQCVCGCTDDLVFKITSAQDGSDVAVITKQWAGYVQEAFTKADNFGVKFPMDLDVKMKATLIGATILVDFALFEQSKQQNHNH